MAQGRTRTTYHHGDLRDALIASAETLMAERTGWTFTLREVARAAGVSHNAPYNHFPDRRALLAAVAARSFDDLTAVLRRHLAEAGEGDIAGGIRAIARGYVAFAAAHPPRFRLMFGAELTGCADPAFQAAGQRAFAVLRDLVACGVAEGSLRPDPDGTHALAAWSLVHGLGTLVLDGRIPVAAEDGALPALSDGIAAALVGGLAAPAAA